MPLIPPPTPVFSVALPNVSVADGQTRTSPSANIPTGITWVRVELDGSAWPAVAEVTIGIDYATDGTNFIDHVFMTTDLAAINANGGIHPFIMAQFDQVSSNANLKARAFVKSVGAAITIVGTLTAG